MSTRITSAELAQIIQDNTGCADSDSVYAAIAVEQALSAVAPPPVLEADEAMARHWIDRYAAGIDDEPQMDRIAEALAASPAAPAQPEGGEALAWRDLPEVESSAEFMRQCKLQWLRVVDEHPGGQNQKARASARKRAAHFANAEAALTRPAPAQQATPAAVGHPHCRLTLTRSIAPDTFWHWIVLMPDGHPYDMRAGMTFEAALADMQTRGVVALDAADTIWRAQQAQAAALASNAAARAADAQEGK